MTQLRTVLFPGGGPQLKESLADYSRRGGYEALRQALAAGKPEAVIEEIQRAGLRGRGGAGFPAAQKLALCAQAEGSQKYVVANGGEDEPGSIKDQTLLVYSPHAVLEGALLAAYAIGASRVIFYINESYESAHRRVAIAISEAQASNLIGEQMLGSGFVSLIARAASRKSPLAIRATYEGTSVPNGQVCWQADEMIFWHTAAGQRLYLMWASYSPLKYRSVESTGLGSDWPRPHMEPSFTA